VPASLTIATLFEFQMLSRALPKISCNFLACFRSPASQPAFSILTPFFHGVKLFFVVSSFLRLPSPPRSFLCVSGPPTVKFPPPTIRLRTIDFYVFLPLLRNGSSRPLFGPPIDGCHTPFWISNRKNEYYLKYILAPKAPSPDT